MNGDTVMDTIFLLHTLEKTKQRSSYYITASLSLHDGFYGTNALFLDYSLLETSFVYKNGELLVTYTTKDASTTMKQKYFVVENGILQQLSHK
jgi:hypothetical protein